VRTNTQYCGILTFAIRSNVSVVLNEWTHLGENHRMRAISAVKTLNAIGGEGD